MKAQLSVAGIVCKRTSMAAEQGELQEQLDGGLDDAQVGAAGPDEVADAQAVPPCPPCQDLTCRARDPVVQT